MIRHIIPISGKDSLATAIVQIKRAPELNYEFIFNPTGAEYPIVYEWLERVEKYLGKKIIRIGDDLESIIEDNGYWLPGYGKRYCTKYSKIKPTERFIGKDQAFVYYGIRYDETRGGYDSPSGRITPVMPLQELGIDITGVYELLTSIGLMPPNFFWPSVYNEVCRLLGGDKLIKELLQPWQIDMLFAGRTRANCFFCYFQMLIEWVWLYETYPDLFWKAENYEHLGTSVEQYTWNANYSLKEIVKQSSRIKKKHIRRIVKKLRLLSQGKIEFGTEDLFADLITTTSCGLFCGK